MSVFTDIDAATAPRAGLGIKARGLMRLVAAGCATPAFAVFDSDEVAALAKGSPSADALASVDALVQRVVDSGAPPLFSVRAESKLDRTAGRPPPTRLNVGLRALPDGDCVTQGGQRVPRARLEAAYAGRVGVTPRRFDGPPGSSVAAVLRWLEWMSTQVMDLAGPTRERCVIVQRMVFGCVGPRSGNGICCNLPDPRTPARRFRGVFLPGQQGIPLIKGAWGDPQVPLSALEALAPAAYRGLADAFARLEARYGPDPYLEFTIEGDALYLLQYEQRRRNVVIE